MRSTTRTSGASAVTRRYAMFTSLALALSSASTWTIAQEIPFPAQTVKLIIPTAPGAGMDLATRMLAEKLSRVWGKPVIVENKPGGDGMVGLNAFRLARGEPHTIFLADIGLISILPSIPGAQTFEPRTEFKPITDLFHTSFVMLARPGSFNSMADLLKAAADNPGKLNYGAGGASSGQRLSVELLKAQSGSNFTFIPYKGNAEALTALIAGDLDLVSVGLPPAKAHIESGRLKALATTSLVRSTLMPQLPTVAETAGLNGFSADSWVGLFASPTMPDATVAKIQRDVATALKSSEFVKLFESNDYTGGGNTSSVFAKQTERDREKYRKLIDDLKLNIK